MDLDPLMTGERGPVKPCAVCKERVAAEMRDGRFQMQAAGDGNGDDFIAVRRKNSGKPANAFRVAALGEADKELSADAKDIAAFESAGKCNIFKLSKPGESVSQRLGLATASFRSERKDYRQFIENDGRVFNKHGVGKSGFGGKRNDAGTQFAEELFVSMMLLPGGGQINGLTVDEGKFAIDYGWADGTRYGGEHGKQKSLHEMLLRRRAGVYRLGIEMKLGATGMAIGRRIGAGFLAGALVFSGSVAAAGNTADEKKAVAVDEIFVDLTKAGSPGCALGVYRDGKMVYSKGYGLANLEENVSITPQSVFDIGSTSKQFTAASILLLEKQGKLSVNDDVRKYIPELPDYGQKVTILHLLNHTSGLRDYLTLMDLAGINTDGVTTDEDALQMIFRQKALNFAPGSDWLYSNTGFFLLSVIVKRASGKTLREFAAENIFTPLEMTHTQFRDDHTSLIANRALAYDAKENGVGFRLNVSYFEQTGDGAVHTSVEDLLKWDENFYGGQVGGKDFLAEIQEQGKLNNGKVLDYAKGLFIQDYRGLRTVSHGGSWGGYRAELLRFPEQHFSVACLCNLGSARPSNRAHRVADVYLTSLMKPKEANKETLEKREKEQKTVSLTPEQIRSYQGDYWSDELGVAYRLGIVDGKLKVIALLDAAGSAHPGNLPAISFEAAAADKFAMNEEQISIQFERDQQQGVKGFTLDAGRTRGMIFTRRNGAGK